MSLSLKTVLMELVMLALLATVTLIGDVKSTPMNGHMLKHKRVFTPRV